MCAKWKVIGGEEHRITRQNREECEQRRRNLPAYQAYIAQLKGKQLPKENRESQHEINEIHKLMKGILKRMPD